MASASSAPAETPHSAIPSADDATNRSAGRRVLVAVPLADVLAWQHQHTGRGGDVVAVLTVTRRWPPSGARVSRPDPRIAQRDL
jgi:hypothetical protein